MSNWRGRHLILQSRRTELLKACSYSSAAASSYVEWPGLLTARAVLCMDLNSQVYYERCRLAEFDSRKSIRGSHEVFDTIDSRFLQLYGNCDRIGRFAGLGSRCYCYWSRRDIVGFEFVISGNLQGYACYARFGETYRPPWYMFGSLELREEMAIAGEKPRCGSGGQARRHPG